MACISSDLFGIFSRSYRASPSDSVCVFRILSYLGAEAGAPKKVLAWTSINWNFTRLIGPIVAGWVIFWGGEAWCFLIDGVSYLIVAVLILLMPVRDLGAGSDTRSIREASKAIWRIPDFRYCTYAIALTSAVAGMYVTFLPVWIEEAHETAKLLGIIRGLIGLGGVLSAIVLIYKREPDVLRALIPFAVKMQMLLTVVCGVISYTTAYGVEAQAVLAFGIGFLWTIVGGGGNIVVQQAFADHDRAVGSSLWSLAFYSPYAVVPILSAGLFHTFGFSAAIVLVAILGFLFAVVSDKGHDHTSGRRH